jgi:hypothetical protein
VSGTTVPLEAAVLPHDNQQHQHQQSRQHHRQHQHQRQLHSCAAQHATGGACPEAPDPPSATAAAAAAAVEHSAAEAAAARARWRSVVAVCAGSALLMYATRTSISTAIVPMAEQFDWDKKFCGTVLSAFFAGYGIT